MSPSVNVHDAKTHLSSLLERVEHGEEIVIARAGRPVARLVPLSGEGARARHFGTMRGKITFADDDASADAAVAALFLHAATEHHPSGT